MSGWPATRPALDAGADPQPVAEWTRQVKNERAAALARDTSHNRQPDARPLTEDDIRTLVTGLGDLRDVIRDAAAAVKAAVYTQLGLKVTYLPGQDKIRADVTISPDIFAGQAGKYGVIGRVRGPTQPIAPYRPIRHSAELKIRDDDSPVRSSGR
jgi:hypothetical protein